MLVQFPLIEPSVGRHMRRHQHLVPATVRAVTVLWAAISAQSAFGFSFVPTMDEWITWPAFCRAKYVTLDLVITTQFANRVPSGEVTHWKEALGEKAFLHVHHYCAALAFYNRALVESDPTNRRFQFSESAENAFYTYQAIGITDPLAPTAGTLVARAKMELGQTAEAKIILQQLIEAWPTAEAPYLTLSSILRRGGDQSAAIQLLERGNEATKQGSAEINYALGLLNLERKQFIAARENAARAYALGYPLPGLRKKLALAGYQL